MKKLVFLLLPLISFAQQKDSIKSNALQPSLNYELNQSKLKNDSLKFNLNINKYQNEAIKLRKDDVYKNDNKILRQDNLRNDLLKHNQSKGKSNLSL